MSVGVELQAGRPGMLAAVIGRSSAAPVLRLAAPLTAFFAIQSAISLAGVAMIGRLGDAALAGLGVATTVYGVVLALMFGADTAVQAMVSRRVGAGRSDALGQVLADAWALTTPLGLALAATMWFAAPGLLAVMTPSPAAATAGVAVLRGLAPSLLFLAITIPVNAGWIGQGRPGVAFAVTAALAPVQIGAMFALVFGVGPAPGLGVAGAGWGNSLACLVGVGLQLALASRPGAMPGLGRRFPRPDGLAAVAAIGWPISLQQALLQLGFIVAYIIIARLGVAVVAAANVLITLATVPSLLGVGFGAAAATLVGQTLGRGDAAEARRWGWRALALGVIASTPFALVALCATRPLLGLFLRDPATLTLAIWPARIAGLGVAANAAVQVLCFALRGAGATRASAAVPFVSQWLVRLPLIWWMAVSLGLGLTAMSTVETSVATLEALLLALIWTGAGWTTHRRLSRAD